ncbi:MAG: DUF1580 domain-containing protein [Phycisphaeraceae bacterium]|nr:DUF1580 domain-containing protein [Phycisphaeraceae bacterium]
MPIDIHADKLCTLTGATQLLPKVNGRHLHASAIWRWCRKGVRGVHLDHVRIGGRIFTSAEALNRFANALAEVDLATPTAPLAPLPPVHKSRTAAEAAAAHRAAEQELDRLGL